MTPPLTGPGCRDCGNRPADTWLSEVGPLCDRCADDRLVAATGLPPLPDPPDPVVLTGPDGRTHRMRYRILRAPTGISLRLREDTDPADRGGYEFAILGDHDADVGELAAALHTEAAAEIGRCYLEIDEQPYPVGPGAGAASDLRGRLQIADLEVAGRVRGRPHLRRPARGRHRRPLRHLGRARRPARGLRRLAIPAADRRSHPG
jgi:hypothetical protein